MAAEQDNRSFEEQAHNNSTAEGTRGERAFDDLTRALANGRISRGRALRVFGAALVGGVLASVPGIGRLAGNGGEA